MYLADLHYYEPSTGHGLRHNPFNAIIAPRPIGWISSNNAAGQFNLAPYSFFNAILYGPPIIGFSSISWKDPVKNVSETREFTWKLVTMDLGDRMNVTAAPLSQGVGEFDAAGLTPVPGRHVALPRLGESRAAMECNRRLQLGNARGEKVEGWFVLGEVVAVYIDKSLIEDGVYRALPRPILRAGRGRDYLEVKTENMFEMKRPVGSSKPEFHGT
ncbi:flavin reductase family protein [Bradyrhizobium sp. F1.13.3]|uniref:flavin reductase family protein n=1 Tax=Bradyrhizobium sp. F1.13.3 TaxID=3156351 RepID=UPI003397BA5C